MGPVILFSRPAHDDITHYLFLFSKELIEFATLKNFKCLNQEKQNATKYKVVSLIEKNKPKFIMFNGHGNQKIICGHQNETIIESGVNHDLLRYKIIYSLSCSSATELGPKSVESGATAFIGYIDEFALGMDTTHQATPLKDKRAKLFLEPSNRLVESLLKGNTVKESLSRSKELLKRNISLLRTDPSPDASYYAPFLFHNYLCLKAHGDVEASLIL